MSRHHTDEVRDFRIINAVKVKSSRSMPAAMVNAALSLRLGSRRSVYLFLRGDAIVHGTPYVPIDGIKHCHHKSYPKRVQCCHYFVLRV
jgi:hypothetical protein